MSQTTIQFRSRRETMDCFKTSYENMNKSLTNMTNTLNNIDELVTKYKSKQFKENKRDSFTQTTPPVISAAGKASNAVKVIRGNYYR